MPQARPVGLFAIAALAAATTFAGPALAQQSVADFYKGKTISIVMGTGPGGSFDVYGRTIAEHMSRHIPGNPRIIVEHMPGAGGVVAANHIYGPAPQDGTRILLSHAIPLVEKLDPKAAVRFESAKFNWLGAYDQIVLVMSLWHTAPAKSVEEMKTAPVIVGSFSRGHLTHQWAVLLKRALGADFKVVAGYPSGNELNLAMERGEIHGWTVSYTNLITTRPQWVKEGKVNTLVQFSFERIPALPKVPTLLELTPPELKDVVELITAGTPFSRAMAVGPKVPQERVAALRKAFDALMKDEAFLAETKKRRLDIDPRSYKEVHDLVNKIASASPELVAKVHKTLKD